MSFEHKNYTCTYFCTTHYCAVVHCIGSCECELIQLRGWVVGGVQDEWKQTRSFNAPPPSQPTQCKDYYAVQCKDYCSNATQRKDYCSNVLTTLLQQ